MAEAYAAFVRELPVDLLHVMEAWGGRNRRNARGLPDHERSQSITFPPTTKGPVDLANVDAHYDSIDATPHIEQGGFDHLRPLHDALGRELMIFPNVGGPSGDLSTDFDTAMVEALADPERARQELLSLCRGSEFARVKAARLCGAEGFIFSLGYGGAMDLISPGLTRRINVDAWCEFFAQLRRIGVLPVGYFLGNIHPYLDIIIETRPAAVFIEESKKGFDLDPVDIRKKLPPEIVLFGNLDSQLLLDGNPTQIQAEVKRQAAARDYGPFAFDNGSPICPGTPADNLRAYLDAARSV